MPGGIGKLLRVVPEWRPPLREEWKPPLSQQYAVPKTWSPPAPGYPGMTDMSGSFQPARIETIKPSRVKGRYVPPDQHSLYFEHNWSENWDPAMDRQIEKILRQYGGDLEDTGVGMTGRIPRADGTAVFRDPEKMRQAAKELDLLLQPHDPLIQLSSPEK